MEPLNLNPKTPKPPKPQNAQSTGREVYAEAPRQSRARAIPSLATMVAWVWDLGFRGLGV